MNAEMGSCQSGALPMEYKKENLMVVHFPIKK
jgi:hypothetical protein